MILKNMRILKRFLILLLVIGSFSCDDDIKEITLYDEGTTDANASATSIDSGGSITFTATTTKEYTLEWNFPGGVPATSTDATVDVIFNNSSFDNVLNSEVELVVKYIDNTTETIKFDIQVAPTDALPLAIPYGGTPLMMMGLM